MLTRRQRGASFQPVGAGLSFSILGKLIPPYHHNAVLDRYCCIQQNSHYITGTRIQNHDELIHNIRDYILDIFDTTVVVYFCFVDTNLSGSRRPQ